MRLNLQLFAVATSIVDYLKSQGQDSSYSARKQLAQQHGISDYKGSEQQNTQLLKMLQSSSQPASTTNVSGGTVTPSVIKGVDQPTYDKINQQFQASSAYQEAMSKTQALLDQITSGRTSYTDQVKSLMDQIQNRDKFEYDMESDALFQQYLSSMMASGQTAMQDTMGQASALTGGYGNSYAQSAGNQTYNSYIKGAYDNLPEYYELALRAYETEGEEMYKELAMLSEADAQEYARLVDSWNANNSTVQQMYGQEYQKWADEVSHAMSLAQILNNDWWNEQNFIESQRQFDLQLEASQSKAKSGSSSVKKPSEAQYKRALEAYNLAGSYGLEQYLASVDEELQDALMDYALEYGAEPVTSMTSKIVSGIGKLPQYLVGGK